MKLPWQAWHGDHEIELDFPLGWQATKVSMADGPAADPRTLMSQLHSPIGTPHLWELARRPIAGATSPEAAWKRKKAVIVVEDITRPTPTAQIIPLILTELESGGIRPEDTYFIMALGAHTPMRRAELIQKLGERIVRDYAVCQNHAHENREFLGETSRGTPVYINRDYLAADLRVSVGGILPHGLAGWAGGYKTVAVGMAGIETLHTNHLRPRPAHPWTGRIEGNVLRTDLEEVGRMVRLDFIVNTVVNSKREIVALFAGDPIEAHRAGVQYALKVYGTHLPPPADIAILNAYPKDSDLVQLANSMNAVGRNLQRAIKPDGTAVLMTACTQGAGIHYLSSVGMRGYGPTSREKLGLGERGLIIYSPNLSPSDIEPYPADTILLNTWAEVTQELLGRHGDQATVSVFPTSALQLPDDIAPF